MGRVRNDECSQSYFKFAASQQRDGSKRLVLWQDPQMDVAPWFDVTATRATVVVSLVCLQKDIFSSDFDTAGLEVHTSRSSEDMRAIPSNTARAIVVGVKEKGLGRMRPESSSKPKEELLNARS